MLSTTSSIYIPDLTSDRYKSICLLLSAQRVISALQEAYLVLSERAPPQRNNPPASGAGCRHTLCELERILHLVMNACQVVKL
jgi:hypothetical protein